LPHWVPSWQTAWLAAAVLALVSRVLVARRRDPGLASALAWEAALVLGLFGLWQLVGGLAIRQSGDAIGRGAAIWKAERMAHLPNETAVQHLVLPHSWLVQFLNGYYVYAHFSTLVLMLLWLFLRHRDRYAAARNTVALTTFGCLAIQLVPVAPPRLLGGYGVVDTASAYGQSVYGSVGTGIADQLSAMPSVHVAWAALVGLFVFQAASGRWRWLGPAHTGMTLLVVVATGNHYWLDAVVAVAVIALATGAQAALVVVARRASTRARPARVRRVRPPGCPAPPPRGSPESSRPARVPIRAPD
jgi:hypothetical protein